ncbi:MAG: Na+/H+ antiporter NhaC family protein [Planctomycetota bacterium]|jgi:Na+/H+ antiporter NhaC
MPWLLLIALLSTQEPTQPHKFDVTVSKDYVVGDVPVDVTITALDDKGERLTTFTGTATVQGVDRLTSTGAFEEGGIVLEKVLLSGGAITVTYGNASGQWEPGHYIPGWLTIIPPLLAIALAIITRQVLIALLAGVWMGVFLISGYDPFTSLLRTFDTYILERLVDPDLASIVMFTLALGGMVGVLTRGGGTKALVDAISKWATSRRSGMITTWVMGLVIFFDDYANCLLVGSSMRPFTDSRKISREKLSFLVDATAAPVTGLLVISTWIGYEISQLANSGIVDSSDAYITFIHMIPYRFYAIFMLLFVLMVAITRRDFGPMLRAERRALSTGKLLRDGAQPLMDAEATEIAQPTARKLLWQNAVVPIVATILLVGVGLYADGAIKANKALDEIETGLADGTIAPAKAEEMRAELTGLRGVIQNSNSFAVLIWASFGGSIIAILMVLLTGALNVSESMRAWVAGCKSMVIAVLILVLAWTLGKVCRDYLQTGDWIAHQITPSAHLMPTIIFLVSCVIAFSTGSSWGTMAIVFPIAGPMVLAATGEGCGLDAATVDTIHLATLASVMSGAIFGDHCSPISDTTIMSSTACAADHIDHVRTQIPYAILCAAVAILVGYLPAGFGFSPWPGLVVGVAILLGMLFLIGRRATDEPAK